MSYGKLLTEQRSLPDSRYGFVNETKIRVGAGIMLTLGLITFLVTYYTQAYIFASVVVAFFWLDFLLKIIGPQYSLIGKIAHIFTKNKDKVRVGAIQKRFAWSIGFVLSSIVLLALFGHLFLGMSAVAVAGLVRPMWICVLCLVFMRCEAILGYCVGCDLFKALQKKGLVRNQDDQNCPDNQCAL